MKKGSLAGEGTKDFIDGAVDDFDTFTRRTVVFALDRDGAFFEACFFVVFFAVAIVMISSPLVLGFIIRPGEELCNMLMVQWGLYGGISQ